MDYTTPWYRPSWSWSNTYPSYNDVPIRAPTTTTESTTESTTTTTKKEEKTENAIVRKRLRKLAKIFVYTLVSTLALIFFGQMFQLL